MKETGVNEDPAVGTERRDREQRVSTVAGHRLCAACGFTLYGQPILREPHYQMLIIRCPECGGIASVQEYPALGRWAGRWAALLAAAWLLALIAAALLSAGALFGMSEGVVEMGSGRYALKIAEAHLEWYQGLADRSTSAAHQYMQNPGGSDPTAYSFVDRAWWEGSEAWKDADGKEHPEVKAVDRAAILAGAGGWWGALDPQALWFLWLVALVGLVIGVFWATALAAVGRPRTLLVLGVIGLIAAGFSWMARGEASQWSWFGGNVIYAQFLAQSQLAGYSAALGLGIGIGASIVGAWVGRSVVRGCIRVLLPPSFRPPLALLWTCDGLAPPSAAPRPAP